MSCGSETQRGRACLERAGYPAVLAVKACARASPVLASAQKRGLDRSAAAGG